MSIEVMKQALAALETCDLDYDYEENPYTTYDEEAVYEAITALRQAIEQAEKQEQWTPDDMAHRPGGLSMEPNVYGDGNVYRGVRSKDSETKTLHYTAPVHPIDTSEKRVDETAKDEHEPVAWIMNGELFWAAEYEVIAEQGDGAQPLYTAPPKREWEPYALDEMAEANKNLAPWLSAALEDESACEEFKSAVRWWFSSGSYDMRSMTRREWQGLTNDEVNEFAAGCHLGNSVQGAIYKAQAKLKEKNT